MQEEFTMQRQKVRSLTLAAMLGAQVKQLEFFAKARNYPTAQEAALDST